MTARRARLTWAAAAAMLVAVLAGCAGFAPAPSGPCLGDLPEIANFSFTSIPEVALDVAGDVERVRFTFDPTVHGVASLTAQPARGPFFEASSGEGIVVAGDDLTSLHFEGLGGGVTTDRIRADPGDLGLVREVVQVRDRNVTRWIIGTAAGSCLRLRVDDVGATVTLLISRS